MLKRTCGGGGKESENRKKIIWRWEMYISCRTSCWWPEHWYVHGLKMKWTDCSINSGVACMWRLTFKTNKRPWLIIQSLNSLHQRAFAFLDAASARQLTAHPRTYENTETQLKQTHLKGKRTNHSPDGLIWTNAVCFRACWSVMLRLNKHYNLRLFTFIYPPIPPNASRFSPPEEWPLADTGSPLTCVTQH